jgi:hypothetical protein
MIRPSGDVRIHLYRQAIDMRKAINGLVSIVEGEMDADTRQPTMSKKTVRRWLPDSH